MNLRQCKAQLKQANKLSLVSGFLQDVPLGPTEGSGAQTGLQSSDLGHFELLLFDGQQKCPAVNIWSSCRAPCVEQQLWPGRAFFSDAMPSKAAPILHSSTLWYTLLHSTTLDYTPLHCTTLYCTLLHSATLYYTLLHSTTLYYTLLHSTTLYDTLLRSTTLYDTLLRCKTLCYTLLTLYSNTLCYSTHSITLYTTP